MGGGLVTRDISLGLQIPLSTAEGLKLEMEALLRLG